MTTKKIGSFGVDSGQFMIIDPCYVWDDDFNLGGEPTGKPYDTACRLTLSDAGHGELEGGVVSRTPGGDGTFDVYGEFDSRGQLLRIVIDFEESEDYWEDEDEDEDELV